ncbi:hypothetical protein [Haladaptatus halobius]|uniref:hypothetical protein n=1 Tax=Haladaptatus halobius TaxID=2884875 RepID=UPI001D09C708|nr:hypothetical protein [Haladaptatus halobius]
MVSTLIAGVILTVLAWLGLQIAVVHGKYVTDKIAEGRYHKGPFRNRDGETNE